MSGDLIEWHELTVNRELQEGNPVSTVWGGYWDDGYPIGIAISRVDEDVLPSKVRMEDGRCTVSSNGRVFYPTEYEVPKIAGENPHGVWTPVFNKIFPTNALLPPSYANRHYFMRIHHAGNLTLGKVNDNGVATFEYQNEEITYSNKPYEVFTLTSNVLKTSPTLSRSTVFRTDGNYLTFRVRALRNAQISFGNDGQMNFELDIGILKNKAIGIKTIGQYCDSLVPINDLLHPFEKRGFWVHWSDMEIKAGREGDLEPLVIMNSGNIAVSGINSVKFSTNGVRGEWLIPPLKFFDHI